MNRRHFISALLGAGAGLALKEAIPFNRVWFLPQKIRLPNVPMYRGFAPGYHEAFGYPGEIMEIASVNVVNPPFRVPAKAVFDPERQVWVVQYPPDPIDWKIVEASIIPSTPSRS